MDCNDPVDERGAFFQGDFLVSEVGVWGGTFVEEIFVPDAIAAVGRDDLVQQWFDVPLDFLWAFEDVRVGDLSEGVFHDLVEVSHLWSGGCQLEVSWFASFAWFGLEGQLVFKLLVVEGVFEVEAELSHGAG